MPPLGTRYFTRILQPGDHLLYGNRGLVSWFIRTKTWSDVSHIEIYLGEGPDGQGRVIASRDGLGVAFYTLRTEGLQYVLRPIGDYSLADGLTWVREQKILGQKYDWWGLLRFFTIGKGKADRQFCSELACRFDRACHFDPFAPGKDADTVAPSNYKDSPRFEWWWVRKQHAR